MKTFLIVLTLMLNTVAFADDKDTNQKCNTYCTEIAGSQSCQTVCTP